VDAITAVVVDMLRSSPYDSAIILSGAGTSGRIAFSIARAFNAVLEKHGKPRCIHYLIAGGDAALLKVHEHIRTVHLSCRIVKVQ
jgi:N-acetylmuramic acid 6-phosphate (MurNAc-6-P) etherase